MEATHRRSGDMDPLLKKVIMWGSILGALTVISSFVLAAATNIVRVKDAVDSVPVLRLKSEDYERRLAEQERVNKQILLWLQAFGDKWDVKPPRPWADRRRPNE